MRNLQPCSLIYKVVTNIMVLVSPDKTDWNLAIRQSSSLSESSPQLFLNLSGTRHQEEIDAQENVGNNFPVAMRSVKPTCEFISRKSD